MRALNTIIFCVISLIIISCSKDDPEDTVLNEEGFEFDISGDIEKTIKGSKAYFANSTSPDIFGEDLNTITFSAVDDEGNGQVSFGITTYDLITKGTYPIEFRIAPEAYNGFANYTEKSVNSPIFGPIGGSIKLKTVEATSVTGSLDASCQDMVSGDIIFIKGNFTATRQ